MNTKPLESFAKAARLDLIRAVDAQATTVLAQDSVARSEREETVRRLEQEIDAHGRVQVIDRVAYIWFNRLIALRFMDANGYTSAGVVSPAHGQEHGQPEILADAKRGDLDAEVIDKARTRDAIIGLLDGTRRSTDVEGEAYALLLTAYCHSWNKAMPFMFERGGDYTELLVPAGLLAEGSVLARAREVLTEAVCQDVEVIGWLYQFYISERKDEVFASFKKNKKAGADEIPAATQLFTPHWIVRYLVENSLGRLWMLNNPKSTLIDQMKYYVAPVDEETDFLQISSPEELTVIDPAAGSGHMLTYAFDLLYAIYVDAGYAPNEIPSLILAKNLAGTEIDPRAGTLAAFALSMKARARDRRFLTREAAPQVHVIAPIAFDPYELDFLVTKSGDHDAEEKFWNLFRHADTFGSLIRPDATQTVLAEAHLSTLEDGLLYGETLAKAQRVVRQAQALSKKYAVVVANPPYMGSKQMNSLLSQFMKDEYQEVKQDLYGAFVDRGVGLADERGLLSIVIGDTWMSIKSFEAMRLRLLKGHAFDSFVHMRDVSNHPDIFGANAAFVVSMTGNPSRRAPFVRLTALGSKRKDQDLRVALTDQNLEAGYHIASAEDFAAIPGTPIVYWLSEKMRAAFKSGRALNTVADLRQGLKTANNDRFLRHWWEVGISRTAFSCPSRNDAMKIGAKWFPYNKGGDFRRWYGNQEFVVNWADDGAEIKRFGAKDGGRPKSRVQALDFFFRSSISWPEVSSGASAFRFFPEGFIFDSTGSSGFTSDEETRFAILAITNSSVTSALLQAVAPGLRFDVGQVAKIPVTHHSLPSRTERHVKELISVSNKDWDSKETSWDFVTNPLVQISTLII